ncbi:MAG: hypothetical protein EOO88_39710, partial [Pedobacter sp.]
MATFRARARALDMLGRQQIAGIPTAISELFKNAHDAYADNVIVDYYRKDRLFILRDDGVGMTRKEFEDRWLSLGTESKLGASLGLSLPPVEFSKVPRPTLGEKGIGRLAIAAIGKQVLVLTRGQRNGVLNNLVVAFINWGIFELPGLDLDEIDIPIEEFPIGVVPNKQDIERLVEKFRDNFDRLREKISAKDRQRLLSELQTFVVDPTEIQKWVGGPRLSDSHGTHFIIVPSEESLTVEIESGDSDGENVSSLIKTLIGFSNTMTPDHPSPHIRSSFRYHKVEEQWSDLIAPSEFWIPDDFNDSDHHIQGRFDEFGQFYGSVKVFNNNVTQYVVPWSGALGTPTECGSFTIDFAYVQGRFSDSILPADTWTRMYRKVARIGGLYIYRDGIRVLPYGDNDYDFLDIEKRRNKSLGYYFFSYRRLFGAIQMSREQNSGLTEKAGREGFRQNKAYRELKSILINFFTQLAADFFRGGGVYAEPFIEGNAELKRLEEARRKRETQANEQRKIMHSNIDAFFADITAGRPLLDADKIIEDLFDRLKVASEALDPQEAALQFLQAESQARKSLTALRDKYRVSKPNGLGLTKQLRREWSAY